MLLNPEDYLPRLSPEVDAAKYGIGLIGCGGIANQAHLPAYRKMGLSVVACCDVNAEAARRTAEKFGIPFWTTDVGELLAREDVRIVDMALHPPARLPVLRQIAQAPRPVLCQKPLALTLAEARELGGAAASAGIRLGVNQQARWAPAHRAMQLLLERETIGEVYGIQHLMRSFQDQADMWWVNVPNFNIADHGVHYLDLCRFFARTARPEAEWTRLHCTTAQLPDQNAVDPLVYSANVEFGPVGGRSPLMASLQFNNIVRASRGHSYTWWIDGAKGSMWGNHKELYVTLASSPSVVHDIQLKGSWFPDGFAGSMCDFIAAVDRGEEPPVTPEDNYRTVAMTTAMVLSSREGRVVGRAELMGEAG
ncbi:Gfo/Idh/MocA family protein [Cohnella zeiphila]|uniref:Gfo/Idh/MocA family oxidoreductase n=1 Tax=Cohnella zeiphila TaxID=2761120 RepID=A0A7X0W149_9BACL|nr:Gfo/Idh/MocA family oxidoreductase [Cohnella zeiphila]MBB6735713.1 Gfo/Idh/MocA family oxidoreductase [Cohnella zeiphila]